MLPHSVVALQNVKSDGEVLYFKWALSSSCVEKLFVPFDDYYPELSHACQICFNVSIEAGNLFPSSIS